MKQPVGSKLCGHYCVARLSGCDVDYVIELIGHERGTQTKVLVAALRSLGHNCRSRLTALRSRRVEDLDPSLLKMTVAGRGGWHWLAWTGSELYDPSPFPNTGRVTSFLVVGQPEASAVLDRSEKT